MVLPPPAAGLTLYVSCGLRPTDAQNRTKMSRRFRPWPVSFPSIASNSPLKAWERRQSGRLLASPVGRAVRLAPTIWPPLQTAVYG